jgi:hypothetical protein
MNARDLDLTSYSLYVLSVGRPNPYETVRNVGVLTLSPSGGPAIRSGARREDPHVLDGLICQIRTSRAFWPPSAQTPARERDLHRPSRSTIFGR